MDTSLERYGFAGTVAAAWEADGHEGLEPARVTAQHRDRYRVFLERGEREAEATGAMRHDARGRADFPVVGDWVAVEPRDDGPSRIRSILPRNSLLVRAVAGRGREPLAANIDVAFVVQALERDFNPNRLERYLALCAAARVAPVAVFTKADLVPSGEVAERLDGIRRRQPGLPAVVASGFTGEGIPELLEHLPPGCTCCLLGSSGAGKSTLLNRLLGPGERQVATGAISASSGKGRHVTVHRELFVLPGGGLLVDNPGMREVGIAEAAEGRREVFATVEDLAGNCRFRDCRHLEESGCAVREALERGELDPDTYANFLKARGEQEHHESSLEERRRRERDFGRLKHVYGKTRGNA